jgi:hypothetical protein
MIINITEAKLGLRKVNISCEVEGEASGKMLKLATQSAKDGVKGAMGAAAKGALSVGLDKAGKAALNKSWTFDGHFNTAEAVKLAAGTVKSPDDIKIISVVDDGAWVGGGNALFDKALAQFNGMRLAGVAEETALQFVRMLMPGFAVPATATITPLGQAVMPPAPASDDAPAD